MRNFHAYLHAKIHWKLVFFCSYSVFHLLIEEWQVILLTERKGFLYLLAREIKADEGAVRTFGQISGIYSTWLMKFGLKASF